jgi:hypothetical protein
VNLLLEIFGLIGEIIDFLFRWGILLLVWVVTLLVIIGIFGGMLMRAGYVPTI